jgi:hypothetical protein
MEALGGLARYKGRSRRIYLQGQMRAVPLVAARGQDGQFYLIDNILDLSKTHFRQKNFGHI